MISFIAYVIAAVCFFLAAAVATDIEHLVEWGLFAVAVGLAFSAWSPGWVNRGQQ